ncbi:MAG: TlpA family protein disulfide reductase [Wenzhouxiangellaceae bacterium]|nr:TlpA family protein disulfide reductase [Wenzhouxiangellaceae bacterium]MBS3747294.1 TlpA family protein disulfide reductase [Wenzhouxiangellaceae bacterium]
MTRTIRNLAVLLLLLATASAYSQNFPPAEPFELATAEGTALELPADQNGIGIYLFWASWCPYCRALMPHLQSLEDEFGDKITIYALNFRDQQDPEVYIAEHGFDFTLLPKADSVAERWGVQGTPGLFIIDRQGRVRFNLYDVLTNNPPGFEELGHTQRAQRRAPFWAARIRQALDEVISGSASSD